MNSKIKTVRERYKGINEFKLNH